MEREEVKALAKEIGQEIGQQLAQQVGQSVSQAIQKLMQSTGASTIGTTVEEGIDDISGDEALEKELIDETGTRNLNRKRTYDSYLHHHLESIGRDRSQYDTEKTDAHEHTNELRQLSVQAMQNAVETANLVGKNALHSSNVTNNQTIDHRDISFDHQINVDEQAWAVESILRNPVFKDALATLMVEIVKGNTTEAE